MVDGEIGGRGCQIVILGCVMHYSSTYEGEVLGRRSTQLVRQLRVKTRQVLEVHLHPVLSQVVVSLELVSVTEAVVLIQEGFDEFFESPKRGSSGGASISL